MFAGYLKIESIDHRINNYLGMLKHEKQKIVAKTFLDRHYRNIHMLILAKLSLPFWLRAEKFTLQFSLNAIRFTTL